MKGISHHKGHGEIQDLCSAAFNPEKDCENNNNADDYAYRECSRFRRSILNLIGGGVGSNNHGFPFMFSTVLISSSDKAFHFPCSNSPSQKFPIRTRSRRSVGWPMAAV